MFFSSLHITMETNCKINEISLNCKRVMPLYLVKPFHLHLKTCKLYFILSFWMSNNPPPPTNIHKCVECSHPIKLGINLTIYGQVFKRKRIYVDFTTFLAALG